MFYHNNDYLIPILIGGTRRKRVLCREIMQSKNAKPHVFSSRFSLYDKLFFKCHLFKPDKELWLFDSLISYAENLYYAIDAGLKIADALAIEANDGAAAKEYVNIIAVKEGNENSEKIQALIKALMSEEVKTFIETTYCGAVVPMF